MPSSNYKNRVPFFDKIFENGVSGYVHTTGVIGMRIVTGVEEKNLDPYYVSPYGGRAKNPGDYSVFLADNDETASAEAFQGVGYGGGYPPNTWSLSYKYEGMILDISQIANEEFKREFHQSSGEYKHEYSRDMRHYLAVKGYVDHFDSIGWASVPGGLLGQGGFVYNWISGVEPTFTYIDKKRLDKK